MRAKRKLRGVTLTGLVAAVAVSLALGTGCSTAPADRSSQSVSQAVGLEEIWLITNDGTLWTLEGIEGTGGFTTWVELGNISTLGTPSGSTLAVTAGGVGVGTLVFVGAVAVVAVGSIIVITNTGGSADWIASWFVDPPPQAPPPVGCEGVVCNDGDRCNPNSGVCFTPVPDGSGCLQDSPWYCQSGFCSKPGICRPAPQLVLAVVTQN